MDSRTTCSICFEPYKGRSPKLMPCFHTFCLPCLVTLRDKALTETTMAEGQVQDDDCCGGDAFNTKDSSTGLSIICPTCRKSNPVPLGGVAQFQTNFYLDGDDTSNSAVDVIEDQGPSTVVRTAQDQLRVMEAVKVKLAGEKVEIKNQVRAIETAIQNRYTLAVNCAAEARNMCFNSLKTAEMAIQDKLEVELMLAENMHSKLSHFLSEQTCQQQPCPTDEESVLLTGAAMRHFRASAEKRVQPTFFTYHPEEGVQALKDLLDDFMGKVALFGQAPVHIPKTKIGTRDADSDRGHNITDAELLRRCREISHAESLKLRQELELNHDADITKLRSELAALKTAIETDPSKHKQEINYAKLSSDLAALVQTDTLQLKQDVASLHKDCAKLTADVAAVEKVIGQIKLENTRQLCEMEASGAVSQKVGPTTSVAFQAELDRDVTTNGRRTLYLRNVISNIGGAYNAYTGVFTAPVTGTYVFMATTSSPETDKKARLDMCLEAQLIAYAEAENGSSTTCHAAVRVVNGQSVCLKAYDDDIYKFGGGGFTSFSGILVQEEL